MAAEPISEKIKNPKFISTSTSTCFTYELTEFRTGPRSEKLGSKGEPLPMGYCETFGRRAVAEAGYLMCAIASLIEFLIRVLIGIFAAPFAWRMDDDNEFRAKAIQLCLYGSIYTLENYFIAMAALVQNVTDVNMSYDQIIPCIQQNNKWLVLQGLLES